VRRAVKEEARVITVSDGISFVSVAKEPKGIGTKGW